MNSRTSHVYGPVPSRRLGRSLGVDLAPYKTCSFDCIYCQLGRTTCRTVEMREWFPLDEVVAQVKERLNSRPDYITLAGSGEPTLYSRIGELIDRIRSLTVIPPAVLTNGSLLWNRDTRKQLLDANLVIPSLDAGDENRFRDVNRPHPEISFQQMLEGLIDFRDEYRGEYRLEVMILGGCAAVNDAIKISRCAGKIKPDRIQLNTATRPPAEDYVTAVDRSHLYEIAGLFDPRAEVIADFRESKAEMEFTAGRESVGLLLERRPCSARDIAQGLGIHLNEALKHLQSLCEAGEADCEPRDGVSYYISTKGHADSRNGFRRGR